MTKPQRDAFYQSAGHTPNELLIAVSMTLAVIYLLWMAWIAYSQFKAWQTGEGTLHDLMFNLVRAAIVALLVGITLTNN